MELKLIVLEKKHVSGFSFHIFIQQTHCLAPPLRDIVNVIFLRRSERGISLIPFKRFANKEWTKFQWLNSHTGIFNIP